MRKLIPFLNKWYSFYWQKRLNTSNLRIRFDTVFEFGNISIGKAFFCDLQCSFLAGGRGLISIGEHCMLNRNVMLNARHGEIIIGRDVLIGPNVVIRSSNHKIRANIPIRVQGFSRGSVMIGNDVWIAANCTILKGAVIPDGCVIGAGSVVKIEKLEPYTIYSGNPLEKIGLRDA